GTSRVSTSAALTSGGGGGGACFDSFSQAVASARRVSKAPRAGCLCIVSFLPGRDRRPRPARVAPLRGGAARILRSDVAPTSALPGKNPLPGRPGGRPRLASALGLLVGRAVALGDLAHGPADVVVDVVVEVREGDTHGPVRRREAAAVQQHDA